MARDLLRLGFDLVERLGNRRHADRAGARAIGAHAHLHLVGVAVDDRHILDRDAETDGDELGEGRLVALAVAVRAGQNLDRADRIDAHFRRFPQADAGAERADRRRRRDAAGFDIGGESDAAQLALGRGSRLARRQALVVGERERLVERARVIARVIGHDDRRLMRERIDEVLPPELGRIVSGFTRRDLDDALDDEGRLRAPGAAIGVDRRGVGVDRVDLAVDARDVVLAREQRRIEIGRHGGRECREIGAEIGDRVHAQAGDLAAGVQREFGVRDMVATMRVGEERLGPIRRPFDRPVDLLRRPGADRLLGVNEDLRAEAAADVGRDDAQLVFRRKADERREHEPRDMRVLARRIKRDRVRSRIVVADGGARLHRRSGSGGC